jgi:hypothetical protein
MRRILAALLLFLFSAGQALAQATPQPPPPDAWFIYTIIIVVIVVACIALFFIHGMIASSKFSLGEALSEEVQITATTQDGNGNAVPMMDANGKPVTITILVGSSSRMIALIGTIVIVILFFGFGAFVLYHFAVGRNMTAELGAVINFLVAGLTLFAPYTVNKFFSIFESLSPKSPK